MSTQKTKNDQPEIAGVSIPSPISIQVPNIAMKSNSLLATRLFSNNLASHVCVSVVLWEFNPVCLEGKIPILKCLHSNEYRANVPPTMQLKLKLINPKLRDVVTKH